MKIEIAVEGPPPAIFELCRRLGHLFPAPEASPDPEDPKARAVFIEEEENLNERLLEISRVAGRAEKELSLTNKFEFRVRNLAYAEPPAGSARLTKSFKIREGSWEVVRGGYDLVLANLVSSVLLRTGDRISSHLKDQGAAVISGFSGRQLSEMEVFFSRVGLVKRDSTTRDGWAALIMVKRGI